MSSSSIVFETSHRGQIHDARLDYYGRILATASSDHTIRLWDVATSKPEFLVVLSGHNGPVWQLSWSHPKFGNLLASCSYDHCILIWKEQSPGNWCVIHRSEEHASSVNCVVFCPWEYGLQLAAASSDGTVSIITYHPNTTTWTRKSFSAHPHGALCVDWSPGSISCIDANVALSQKRLVTGGCDSQIRIWTFIETTEEWIETYSLNTEHLSTDWIRDVAWRPRIGGMNMIASCSSDGSAIIWTETDDQAWKAKQVIKLQSSAWRVAWSITGNVLAVTTSMQKAVVFRENLAGTWEEFEQDSKPSFKNTDSGAVMNGNGFQDESLKSSAL